MKLAKQTLIFSLLTILACSTKKPTESQSNDSSLVDTLELKTEIEPKENLIKDDTFYKANGNEPGWRLVIFEKKKDSFEFDVLLDYEEVKLSGMAELIGSNETLGIDSFRLNSDKNPIYMKVVKEECVDESEKTSSTSITLEYNERKYLGCGNYKSVK